MTAPLMPNYNLTSKTPHDDSPAPPNPGVLFQSIVSLAGITAYPSGSFRYAAPTPWSTFVPFVREPLRVTHYSLSIV
jgi:hypothetical protein